MDIVFSADYPFKPPVVKFITKVYHPNIDDDGSICVSLLKNDVWKPATKLHQGKQVNLRQSVQPKRWLIYVCKVLGSIADLLENPNPEDALVASIGEVYTTNRTKFNKTAKDYVKKVSFQFHQHFTALPYMLTGHLPQYATP